MPLVPHSVRCSAQPGITRAPPLKALPVTTFLPCRSTAPTQAYSGSGEYAPTALPTEAFSVGGGEDDHPPQDQSVLIPARELAHSVIDKTADPLTGDLAPQDLVALCKPPPTPPAQHHLSQPDLAISATVNP